MTRYRLTPRQWDAVRLCQECGYLRATWDAMAYVKPTTLSAFVPMVPTWRIARLMGMQVLEYREVARQARAYLMPAFVAWLKAHDARKERRRA